MFIIFRDNTDYNNSCFVVSIAKAIHKDAPNDGSLQEGAMQTQPYAGCMAYEVAVLFDEWHIFAQTHHLQF